ncbi:MAG: hypothetical protein LN364_02695 [Candidatus Thermoplasmatota archaeon]|nr:hypothetical protein [Candidatus Thermoplasmatota archaeon]
MLSKLLKTCRFHRNAQQEMTKQSNAQTNIIVVTKRAGSCRPHIRMHLWF